MKINDNRQKFKKRYIEYGRAYYLKNRKVILSNVSKNYAKNRLKRRKIAMERYYSDWYYTRVIYDRCKQRAKKLKLPFDIGVEDIIIPKKCPVFGFKLKRCIGSKTGNYNSPSIDRIIPELGYVKGNIQIISYLANAMKSNATKEQLLLFSRWIDKTYKQT